MASSGLNGLKMIDVLQINPTRTVTHYSPHYFYINSRQRTGVHHSFNGGTPGLNYEFTYVQNDC